MRRPVMVVTTLLALASLLVATPSAQAAPRATPPTTITLMTHDSFAVSKSVLASFTKQTGIKVKILQAGDAGAALNQAILTKSNPLADAFFGVDNTFLGRALDADIFDLSAEEAKKIPSMPGSLEEALSELERCANTQFDPQLIAAFVRAMRQLPNPIIEVASLLSRNS